MRIDIIHMRDPDSECYHEVYVNGNRIDNAHVHDFDPGAGYCMSEFEETKQEHIDSVPEFLKERIGNVYDDMKPSFERWGYE